MEYLVTIGTHLPAGDGQKLKQILIAALIACFAILPVFSQAQLSTSPDQTTLIVEDAPDMEVYAIGKSVIVKQRAKGVLAFGGDVIVEGRVEEDVATIGGSIIQKENAYIGGDVIAFGGEYRPEARVPLREAGKETLMYGAFEEELRNMAQNPSQIFSPSLTPVFFAQRLLSILFWFLVTFGVTTLAPGAVSRGVARFQLSALKVVAIGIGVFLLTIFCTILSVRFLPDYISVITGLMVFVLLLMSYVFGRVALQVSVGKMIQRRFFAEGSRSETIAILLGVLAWTLVLSIPYVWTLALFVLFAGGIGLVLTARSKTTWQRE